MPLRADLVILPRTDVQFILAMSKPGQAYTEPYPDQESVHMYSLHKIMCHARCNIYTGPRNRQFALDSIFGVAGGHTRLVE
ncbi:hypothetical protein COCMIDRAFT_90366 [Bipolaris oryzae ATCC 44560]|uniref:Uncharacterized protein n=1 Tax=Bipolaris oryzae ATCC 44560 TaxID=930090 RepID=W6ZJ03_COCMI|nr:uncharacterized protein COCMIDRAFT_90366 [Bipolaris oryzae ATCC 44560]EUC47414.1 hypothetical protein COCMIDRAFT_90366 [Bipolaris oryzae ATCC 44560]